MSSNLRSPLLAEHYEHYLRDEDDRAFTSRVSQRYSIGTLERLAWGGERMIRRAAVFALGLLGDFRSNAILGRALHDEDRGVRTLAESGIRVVWCRAGSEGQRRELGMVIRMNSARRFADAIRRATRLVESAPWLAEAWNQRAIAYFRLSRYEESIADCRQALEENPYHFGAASGMGQCHLRLGDRTAALACFRRALSLNPSLDGVRAQVSNLEAE